MRALEMPPDEAPGEGGGAGGRQDPGSATTLYSPDLHEFGLVGGEEDEDEEGRTEGGEGVPGFPLTPSGSNEDMAPRDVFAEVFGGRDSGGHCRPDSPRAASAAAAAARGASREGGAALAASEARCGELAALAARLRAENASLRARLRDIAALAGGGAAAGGAGEGQHGALRGAAPVLTI